MKVITLALAPAWRPAPGRNYTSVMVGLLHLTLIVLQLVAIAGLARRGRARRARLFTVCLAVNTATQLLQLGGPTLFHRWDVWAVKELLLILLVAAAVMEITARVFARLPYAGLRARGALAMTTVATVLMVWTAPGMSKDGVDWLYVAVTEVLPRMALGSALLCMSTLAAMTWYRLAPDRFYRAVLFGLAFYLLAYAGPLATSGTSETSRLVMYHATPTAYVAVMTIWVRLAWTRDDEPCVPRDVACRVQPWR